MRRLPAVSVVLTTHDRPHLFPLALRCYGHQTYVDRELIVVDDSVESIDAGNVHAAGGRLIQAEPGTPLGAKLNLGLVRARGELCLKMDDDDWYAPTFLERMVEAMNSVQQSVCRPCIAGVAPYVFFDIAGWVLRRGLDNQMSGATLLFRRSDWEDLPFRPIFKQVDWWFQFDHARAGTRMHMVDAPEMFLQLRHQGHLWMHAPFGEPLDAFLQTRPQYDRRPEDLLPDWALVVYRELRGDLLRNEQVVASGVRLITED